MKIKLKEHIQEKIKKKDKALNSVWINVLGVISYLELTDEFVLEYLEDAKKDNIFKSLDFLNGGNWIDEVKKPKYIKFLQTLFETCPKGIGTPNAACGEGELMLILSSPRITKPTKNDIKIDNKITKNIKDDKPRIYAEIEGVEFNKKLMQVIDKIGLKPVIGKGLSKSVQLINPNYVKKHWNPQFLSLNKIEIIDFLTCFLLYLFPDENISKTEINDIVLKSLDGNQIVWDIWIEELIIFIFKYGKDKSENLVSMRVDGSVKVIPSNLTEFNTLVRKKEITFHENFFRLFQKIKVAIYINIK
jgi:hypothetical protein